MERVVKETEPADLQESDLFWLVNFGVTDNWLLDDRLRSQIDRTIDLGSQHLGRWQEESLLPNLRRRR